MCYEANKLYCASITVPCFIFDLLNCIYTFDLSYFMNFMQLQQVFLLPFRFILHNLYFLLVFNEK